MNEITVNQSTSVTERLAIKYRTDKARFYNIVKATCKMEKATNEQFEAFLMIAEKYDLNPIIKQLWGYPDRNGGISTMVSIDGWITIVNQHPQFDGYETTLGFDDNGKLVSATCTMWRKDKPRPYTKTIYVEEWKKESSPVWKTMPKHFAEIRAYIQCARMCFNIGGIEDEATSQIIHYPDAIDTKSVNKFNPEIIEKPIFNITNNEADFEISPEIIPKAEKLNLDVIEKEEATNGGA